MRLYARSLDGYTTSLAPRHIGLTELEVLDLLASDREADSDLLVTRICAAIDALAELEPEGRC
jgi:hypothetical protein